VYTTFVAFVLVTGFYYVFYKQTSIQVVLLVLCLPGTGACVNSELFVNKT